MCQITIIQYNNWKKTHGDKKDIISQLFMAFDHDLMLLFNHPLTFRDIIVFMAQI
ncbi:hypothetical protein J3R82DRAFT_2169 [Butyriboletus roseoflavus]|nr:hypothetical protein J3R82DRAFT_2169 [Butyriboletus roseoflavus]